MRQEKEVHIFRKHTEAYGFLVQLWEQSSSRSIAERGRFAVALSGGKTPGAFFKNLSQRPRLTWDTTHIFQVDERFVSQPDNNSNLSLIKETLTGKVAIPDNNIHFITTGRISPEESARRYEQDLRRFFNNERLPRFDLVLLGIGDDGHTASLFPGSSSLHEKERLVIVVVAKRPPRERISLTLPVINNARAVVFLLTGEDKAPVIKKILKEKDSALPAALVKPVSGTLKFVLDQHAASLFSQKISF